MSGYDPFSEKFNDSSVLTEKYDFIFAQDVIEHSPQPLSFMKQLTDLLKTDGILVLGTPRSDNIDFASIEDSHHQIHAPFHLHIFSEKQLVKVAEAAALKVERVRPFNPTNTWLPFLNWSFLESYMATKGNFIDSALEAPDLKQIFFSPRLLLKGLFGFWIGRSQPDMLLIARKADRLSR